MTVNVKNCVFSSIFEMCSFAKEVFFASMVILLYTITMTKSWFRI